MLQLMELKNNNDHDLINKATSLELDKNNLKEYKRLPRLGENLQLQEVRNFFQYNKQHALGLLIEFVLPNQSLVLSAHR